MALIVIMSAFGVLVLGLAAYLYMSAPDKEQESSGAPEKNETPRSEGIKGKIEDVVENAPGIFAPPSQSAGKPLTPGRQTPVVDKAREIVAERRQRESERRRADVV